MVCWLLQGERGREGVREERSEEYLAAAACGAPTRVLVGLGKKKIDRRIIAVTA
jgi:hypothetical protein